MMTKNIAIFAVAGLTLGSVHAASVAIADSSFEQLAQNPGDWNNNIGPNWIERDSDLGPDDPDSFVEHIAGFSADGVSHLGMATGYYASQDLGVAWQANTTYTLTVAFGKRTAGQTSADNVSVFGLLNAVPLSAGYADTAAVLADSALVQASGTGAAGGFADLTFADGSVEFTTGAVAPTGNVVVFIGDNSPAARSHFDNIRLDATVVPEPTVSLLAGLAGLALLRRRR